MGMIISCLSLLQCAVGALYGEEGEKIVCTVKIVQKGEGMTQNQLAYQANLIKSREASVDEAKQKLATSQHLHDYGRILVPKANSDVESGGQLFGLKSFSDAAKAWKDIISSGGILASGK